MVAWGTTGFEELTDAELVDLAQKSYVRLTWELAKRLEAAKKVGAI